MIRVRGSMEGFKVLLAGDPARHGEAPEPPAEGWGAPAAGPVTGREARHAG